MDDLQTQIVNGKYRAVQDGSTSMLLHVGGTPGSRITIVIPAASYHDMAGNTGAMNVIIEIDVPQSDYIAHLSRGVASLAPVTAGAAVATAASTTLLALTTGASVAKSNLIRTGYHFQVMSMSANLAAISIPGERGYLVYHWGVTRAAETVVVFNFGETR